MARKWQKEIKEWADGAEVEIRARPRNGEFSEWKDCDNPAWVQSNDIEYRIKPQPKEPQYLYVWEDIGGINITSEKNFGTDEMYLGKIKLEQDE